MEIISRKEAKAKGLKTYFNGKPCPHGHIAPRDVQSCVCLDCKILYEKTQKFKDTLKNSDLKRKYGITLKQYNKLLEEQDHKCLICGLPSTAIDKRTGQPRQLAVDHDHSTNKVRGLLCSNCNTALGLLNEDRDRIYKLLEYIS